MEAARHNIRRDSVSSIDEQEPLLGGVPATKSSWSRSLKQNVSREKADLILLLCYIITGLLDSAAISTWGSFVSMQTGKLEIVTMRDHNIDISSGNTVYIGLGLSAPKESTRWIKSSTSLASFCMGSFVFSRLHRYFSPSRRWVLCSSYLLQTLLIVVAAAILTWGPPTTPEQKLNNITWDVLIPIALVAFQSCGQAVTSRILKYNALTSVVLTSTYCDLFSDVELFARDNVERNRRIGAPVLLLFGAFLGGTLARSELGTAGVLWVAAGLKACVVAAWYFWRAEDSSM